MQCEQLHCLHNWGLMAAYSSKLLNDLKVTGLANLILFPATIMLCSVTSHHMYIATKPGSCITQNMLA
jgi:hypothetical protein